MKSAFDNINATVERVERPANSDPKGVFVYNSSVFLIFVKIKIINLIF